MKKNFGLLLLLVVACAVTFIANDRFLAPVNVENLLRRTALFSVLSVAVSFVITTGGIDLSVGSMVCLVGTLLPWLTAKIGIPWQVASLGLLLVAALLGLAHGILATKLKLQPFIITLCGLLLYRGVARGVTGDQTQGFGGSLEGVRALILNKLSITPILPFGVPYIVFVALTIAVFAGFLMNYTPLGLYLKAIGRNETASRYCGVNTAKVTITAYTLCAVLSGLGGVFFILDVNSAQPSDFGNFYELYAIAAAVLGGCSLRGGEVSIVGVVLGTMLMQVLRNAIVLMDIPTQLEFAIIGGVILLGTTAEEIARVIYTRKIAQLDRGHGAL
jgi:ribose transport system permease protein